MNPRARNAVALIAVSFALLNAYHLIHYLPGDLLKSVALFVTTAAGVSCLVIGVLRLLKSRRPEGE